MTTRDEAFPAGLEQDFLARLEASGLSGEAQQAVVGMFHAALASQFAPREESSTASAEDEERTHTVETIANDPANIFGLYGAINGPGQGVVAYKDAGLFRWNIHKREMHETPDTARVDVVALTGEEARFNRAVGADRYDDGLAFQAVVFRRSRPLHDTYRSPAQHAADATLRSLHLQYYDPRLIGSRRYYRGETTTFTVILPKDSTQLAQIETDPSLMIDLLRVVFPEADKSEGQLRLKDTQMHEGFSPYDY